MASVRLDVIGQSLQSRGFSEDAIASIAAPQTSQIEVVISPIGSSSWLVSEADGFFHLSIPNIADFLIYWADDLQLALSIIERV